MQYKNNRNRSKRIETKENNKKHSKIIQNFKISRKSNKIIFFKSRNWKNNEKTQKINKKT